MKKMVPIKYLKEIGMATLATLMLEGEISPSYTGLSVNQQLYQTQSIKVPDHKSVGYFGINSSTVTYNPLHESEYLKNRKRVVREFLANLPDKYLESIKTKSLEDIVNAMIQVESAGDPSAESEKGAIGLMQIMDYTKDKMVEKKMIVDGNLYDSEYNKYVGAVCITELEGVLRRNYLEWDALSDEQKIGYIAAAYNYGSDRFMNEAEWDLRKTPTETQNHVERINDII